MQHEAKKPTIIPRQRSALEQEKLKAPDIKVAFHDQDNPGLLPVDTLTSPITAELEVWTGARPGYTYQMIWDTKREGEVKEILETDHPGDLLTLQIPVVLLAEGTHELSYVTINNISLVENYSEIFNVVIDKTAPGSPQLAAMQFPIEVQNGLTAAELEQLGGTLTAQIPGYTGMAKHDLIRTKWGDTEGPTVTVNQDDMGLNRIIVNFTRDFLESIGDEEQHIHYHVTDRAGNVSIDSDAIAIILNIQDTPSDFPAPLIDPSVGDLIDYREAQAGVKIDIPGYTEPNALDQIKVWWGEGNPMQPVEVSPGDEGEAIVLTLRVPFYTINAFPESKVDIYYEVFREGKLYGTSLPTPIDVFVTLPVTQPLVPLIIQGASVENPNVADNFIDEDDYELNARAIVTWNNEFEVSDDLNLHWGEQEKAQWYQLRASDIAAGRDLTIPITNEIMRNQGTGAEIPVHFTLGRVGNPNLTKAPSQLVVVRSKEELPGGVDGLSGPAFNLNANGVISPIENSNGADVKIDPYVNISKDQKITFYFKGFDDNGNAVPTADYTATRGLDEEDVIHGYTFRVPYQNLRTICSGFAEASFKVEPAPGSNQSPANSKITRAKLNMLDSIELTCEIR